ncbi:hypothetical protein [Klebsiella variicola]|uniref:hypothetical protein n=1 Tax=Klebsiella variicola TaxID=244366 RepID=UPI002556EC36|nr:hypothetical protein [Klebsiella variicola]MEC6021100.1 hypothetical protein [Klebsiella variicola]
MNKPATLTPKAPLLMLVAALALSTSFYAGATPVLRRLFSITPSSKLSKLKRKKRKALRPQQSKRQTLARTRTIKKRRPITHSCKKESPANRQRLRKKIKLSNN